jgi:hypothetical protein
MMNGGRTKCMERVRRRLREEDVVGVIVRPNGTIMNVTRSNIGNRLPQKGKLYSRLSGMTRLFCQSL